ncbi:uncharacterized protein LOC132925199 [Rhopalosiphum padi]|uniref:uncharacterized protein LOC132925199 n=1 Tax=Rhopalosiphum padi TaxID=40932 RepID=UPI00298E5027|nr:uncharacterized protein LOC132925199 [Rhopalosiphum padi]
MIIVKIFILIGFSSLVKSKIIYMHNLPLGEYRTVFEKVYSCQSSNLIQFNVYFNKRNITEVKGNFYADDSVLYSSSSDVNIFDINAASWSLTGGWKPISIVYVSKKACSSLKMFAGNAWYSVIKAFNIPRTSCPIPLGSYITSGLDLKKLEKHNFPKMYFYGKYKMALKIRNEENK